MAGYVFQTHTATHKSKVYLFCFPNLFQLSDVLPLRRRTHGVEMLLCGRCDGRGGGRTGGDDRVIGRRDGGSGGVVTVVAGATVAAAGCTAVVARHVVIAVGPPRSGAAAGGGCGRSSLGVGVVIDVGAVRRRRRHRSCRTERKEHTQTQKPDNFRFTASLFSILFFLLPSFSPPLFPKHSQNNGKFDRRK